MTYSERCCCKFEVSMLNCGLPVLTKECLLDTIASKTNMATVVSCPSTNYKNTKWSGVEVLLDDLSHLVNDHETGDVLFLVGEEELRIYAHRLILTTRCEFFRKRARDLWSKTYSPASPYVIKKLGFKPNVFREVIDFIYTGQVKYDFLSIARFI